MNDNELNELLLKILRTCYDRTEYCHFGCSWIAAGHGHRPDCPLVIAEAEIVDRMLPKKALAEQWEEEVVAEHAKDPLYFTKQIMNDDLRGVIKP